MSSTITLVVVSVVVVVAAPAAIGLSPPTTTMTRWNFLSRTLPGVAIAGVVAVGNPPATCEDPSSSAACAAEATPRYIDETIHIKDGPRSRDVLVRRFTGDSTPFSFPVRPLEFQKQWPADPPFQASDFSRADESRDDAFYSSPRLVYHIDEGAVSALTQYYRKSIPPGSSILDICSSWISHYPVEFPTKMKRISGTGMSAVELQANTQLTDLHAQDLNIQSKLPYEDNTFDVVTCVVSIDYLIRPMEVLREVRRVLKPGAKVIVSQSNRFFPTKAISMWLRTNEQEHLEIINAFFQYAGGFEEPRKVYDITPTGPGVNDPMYIVEAVVASKS